MLLDLLEEQPWSRTSRRTAEAMRGQHRDDCRAHRALRHKGACPACTCAAQHASLASLGCQATAVRSNVMLFAYRLLCVQATSYADDPAAGDLIVGAKFDVLNFAMVAGRRSLRSRPPEAARRAARRAWARSAAAPAWHVACLAHGDGWGAVRAPTDDVHAHMHLVLPLYYTTCAPLYQQAPKAGVSRVCMRLMLHSMSTQVKVNLVRV